MLYLKQRLILYLMEDGTAGKKGKSNKKCVMKWRLNISDYKSFLLNNELILKSQQRLKMYTMKESTTFQ